MCRKKGLIKAAAVVHHIKPITPQNINDPRITLNTDNLMALCTDCHAEIHSGKPGRRYTVDALGRVIAPPVTGRGRGRGRPVGPSRNTGQGEYRGCKTEI